MKGEYEVINRLLNETMHMDFPFLASEDKKKRIVEDKKIYIEDTIKEAFAISMVQIAFSLAVKNMAGFII